MDQLIDDGNLLTEGTMIRKKKERVARREPEQIIMTL